MLRAAGPVRRDPRLPSRIREEISDLLPVKLCKLGGGWQLVPLWLCIAHGPGKFDANWGRSVRGVLLVNMPSGDAQR